MLRLLYNILFPIVLVVLLPGFLRRMVKRGKYRHKFGQRFGVYSNRVREKLGQGGWTWIHAVSVGEVFIALKLIAEMKRRDPSLRVVLSSTTSTGFTLANEHKSEWLEPIYNPVDFYWCARAAVRLIRPARMLLIEAEVWPNLTAEVKAAGAPVVLVNARLSHRSEARYRAVKPLTAWLFNQLDFLCVTDLHDAERWKSLGVRPEIIRHTGSIKFDEEGGGAFKPRDFTVELGSLNVGEGRPVLLGGSTHAGEEVIMAGIFLKLRKKFPGMFLIVVPRHVERWKEIRDELTALGMKVALRVGDEVPVENPDVLVVNTTGELRSWYAYATVVFVGKSLTAKGGQNPAEAVAAGKAVVFGPNMQNFELLVAQLLREQGAVQVADEGDLLVKMEDLFCDEAKRAALAANGVECLKVHGGATRRTADLLEQLKAA